jgi:large subunit ribosomal protein L21
MFAVFKTGGKQYRVAAEDVLTVDKVNGAPGEIIEFGDVLLVGGDGLKVGAPTISGATVAAEVLAQGRGPKIVAFKKRRRKNSRRKRGHRQEFTLVRITEILTDGKKANKAVRPRPAPSPAAEAAPAAAPAEAAPSADVGNSATSSARKAAITKAKEGGKIKKPAAKAKGSPPKGKKK